MFTLKFYHGYQCSHFLLFPSLFYSFAQIDCDACIFSLEMYSCDSEHQRGKNGENLNLPETISWQMKFAFKCFKSSHIFLCPLVEVPLFGFFWKLKEATFLREKKVGCVESYMDSSSGFGLCVVQF